MRLWPWRALVASLVALAAAVAPRAGATELGDALHLDEVVAAALRSHPLLQAAELEREVAASELMSARGAFDLTLEAQSKLMPLGYYDAVRVNTMLKQPTEWWGLSAFAGWQLGSGEFPVYAEDEQTRQHGRLRAGVKLPLWRDRSIDRRRANVARAELGPEIAELSIVQQRIEIRRSASHRYWSWVAAGRRLAIAEALLDNVMRRDAAIALRVASGDLPPIEQIENARAVEQRRAFTAHAGGTLARAAVELGLFLRDERGQPAPPSRERLPREFPEIPLAAGGGAGADAHRAQSQRPETRRLALQERRERLELEWAENQLAPAMDLEVAAARDLGPSVEGRPDLDTTRVEASFTLELPVQTRQAGGRAGAALANIERLGMQQRFARDRIDADVRDAHAALAAARQRIDAASREVAFARQLEEAERSRFAEGESNLLLVNLREQQTAEAELRKIDAMLDHFLALADLTAARGQ